MWLSCSAIGQQSFAGVVLPSAPNWECFSDKWTIKPPEYVILSVFTEIMFWRIIRNLSIFASISEVLQHVILAKKPYERRLRGAALILYVILVRKPRNERPRYRLST